MCTCHPPQTQDIHEKLRKEAPALAQTNGGCLPHKVLSTMAHNCPTAKATASCGSVYCQAVTVKVYEPSHEHAGQRMKTASARRQQPYGLLPPVETKGMDTMVAAYTSLVAARAQKMRERAQKETASRRNSSKGKHNKAATRTVQRAAQAGGAAQAQTPRRSKRQRQL